MPWRKRNKLVLVRESQADDRVRALYQDIKRATGVPHLNVVWQAFGAYPEMLERQWRALAPVVASERFFTCGERVRAEAYTRVYNYFQVPDLCTRMAEERLTEHAREELSAVVDLFYYEAPLLLLLMAVQLRGFESDAAPQPMPSPAAEHAVFEQKPVFIVEDDAPAPLRKLYDDIKRGLELPYVNTEFRAFARWPDFLQDYWTALKPVVQSPIYRESESGMRETAWALARELPPAGGLGVEQLNEAGVDEDEVADVVRITDLFLRNFSGKVLNVSFAKIGMEGGSRKASQTAPPATPQQAA